MVKLQLLVMLGQHMPQVIQVAPLVAQLQLSLVHAPAPCGDRLSLTFIQSFLSKHMAAPLQRAMSLAGEGGHFGIFPSL